MLSVQLGSALSVDLISTVGPAGTAWLRLSMGALIFLALARPPLRAVRRHDVPALLALGVTTGLVTIAFLAAIERIPLGTAVAVEFLGPLTVAAVRSHSRRALAWPALALLGVILLTQPWHGVADAAGLGFAGLAAIGWATYILLTQRIGERFPRLGGPPPHGPPPPAHRRPLHRHRRPHPHRPHRRGHGGRRRHPPGRRPPHPGRARRRGRAGHPAPGPALRLRAARATPHDSRSVRDPHGARTGDRGASRAARAAPAALPCPARRHPARRPGRRRRPRPRSPPTR